MLYDTIIIGASAAGMSAAVYAARRNLKFIVVAKDIGGEMLISGEIGNWPSVSETNGVELTQKFKEQMDHYNVEIHEGESVTKVEKEGKNFKLTVDKLGEKNEYSTKSILVATGIHPRELGVPREEDFKGKGITYCTVCDGPLYKDKVTATIGGGNSALESALMMNEIAKKVYLINIYDTFRKGDDILIKKTEAAKNIEIITEAETTKILGNNFVEGLEYTDKKTGETKKLEVDGVMVHIGSIPNSQMIEIVDKNKFGEIEIDGKCKTSVEGIFAAGDVANVPYKQLAIAAGSGVCAALSMVEYLNKLEE